MRIHQHSSFYQPSRQQLLFSYCLLVLCSSWNVHAFSTSQHPALQPPRATVLHLPPPASQHRFCFQLYDAAPPKDSTTSAVVAVKDVPTEQAAEQPNNNNNKGEQQTSRQQPYMDADGVIIPGGSAVAVIGTQSLLVPLAIGLSYVCDTPNYGFGPNIEFSLQSLLAGCVYTVPLGILAFTLDKIEDKVPALQEVTKATQRAVVSFLGSEFRPLPTFLAATGIGLAAGFGEELLFRGVFQYGLVEQLDVPLAAGIGVTAIVFGLLHAVTPLYIVLAALASVYFGSLYAAYGNLAIPIVTHAVYDIGALVYAHWEIGQKSPEELMELFANVEDEDDGQ